MRCLFLGLALLLASAALPAAAQPTRPREVVIANETDRILQEIYIHPAQADSGEDRLGNAVLPPRATLRVPLGRVQGCAWAVRVLFDDGEEERRRLDLCRGNRVVLADTGPRRELEVVNDADIELRELYLWPTGTETEGPDRLGSGTVAAGETLRIRLRGSRGCSFNLRAVFDDDSEEARERVDLCRSPRLGFGDPNLPMRLQPVVNRNRAALRELYARVPGAAAWGADRLGSETIAPRGTFTLRLRSRECRFDLRAVFADDREEVQPGLDLCRMEGVLFNGPASDVEERELTLLNATGHTVQQVFLVAAGQREWGDDRLGNSVLVAGARRAIISEVGCQADLRIVFDSMAAEERRGIDICANPALTLRPGWVVAAALVEQAAAPAAALEPRPPEPLPEPPQEPLPAAR